MPAPALLRARDGGSAATRRAILAAAEALLAQGGEAGLSIRELCARARVTAPTVYHHFGDKGALLDLLVGGARRHLAADRGVLEVRRTGRDTGARGDAQSTDHPAHLIGGRPWRTTRVPIPFSRATSRPGAEKARSGTSRSRERFLAS